MCNMGQQLHLFGWSGAYEKYAGSERYEIKKAPAKLQTMDKSVATR
jgi:hypothetical protein